MGPMRETVEDAVRQDRIIEERDPLLDAKGATLPGRQR
jgi:hypothetical protein